MNKKHRTALLAAGLGAILFAAWLMAAKPTTVLPYQNPKLSPEERVQDLLGRMTLEEKVAQLQCTFKDPEKTPVLGANGIGQLACVLRKYLPAEGAAKANRIQKLVREKTRLKIPVVIHDEALHGILAKKGTSFPQAIGLASTWDTDLMVQVAAAIGRETRSRGIRQVLSPVVNIARDVRWGRVEETYGEDPYLTSRMGVAFCRAIEEQGVITTPKHYAANVGDGGRDSNAVHFSERLLREVYFPGFKACFQEGGARSVMAAYNSLEGVPCSASRWLLTDILRREWGFTGTVVSDYGSVGGILDAHHAAASLKEAAKMALEAGLDIELPEVYIYGEPLLQAVREGLVAESAVDAAVCRVLLTKFRIGLFDDPFVDPKLADRLNDSSEHRQLALQAAREAIVLLKNEGGLLPLPRTLKSVAVIGPAGDTVRLGGYSGFGLRTVSLLQGVRSKLPAGSQVLFAKGCNILTAPLPPIPTENLLAGEGQPEIHGLKGEYFNNMKLEGGPALVRTDRQVNFEWDSDSPDPRIHPDQFSVRWTGRIVAAATKTYMLSLTSDDGIRFWLDGRLMLDKWIDRGTSTDTVPCTLEARRAYDVRIEYYENGGSAFAAFGWDTAVSDRAGIEEAVAAAKSAEAIILAVGINEGEGQDRSRLELPGMQEDLIRAVAAASPGKPVTVVLLTGSAVTISGWEGAAPAIVEAWYPGEEGGNALADVLFGDYNPGGRLPITFPRSVGQVPLYSNFKPTGRGYDYVDGSGKPLFPFGHGLSYTRFDYANLRIAPAGNGPDSVINVTADVRNAGSRRGDEVVQLYLHCLAANPTRPVQELKGFHRITLDAGEARTVSFTLAPGDLAHPGLDMNPVVEAGTYEIWIGASAADIRLKAKLEVPATVRFTK